MRVAIISLGSANNVVVIRGEAVSTKRVDGDYIRVKRDEGDTELYHAAFVYPEEHAENIIATYNEYVRRKKELETEFLKMQYKWPHL